MIYDIWYIYIYNQQYSWKWRALKGVWSQSFQMTQFHPGVGCNYSSKAFGLVGAVNDAFLIAETLQVRPNSPGEKEMFLLVGSKNRTVRLRHEDVLCSSLCLGEVLEQSWAARQKCQAHMGFRHENVCVLHDVYPGQKKSLKAKPDLLHPVHPNKISTSISTRILPSELQCHQCPGISGIIWNYKT